MANRYRPSPLVRGIGPKMLPMDDQRGVHDKIATELASRNPLTLEKSTPSSSMVSLARHSAVSSSYPLQSTPLMTRLAKPSPGTSPCSRLFVTSKLDLSGGFADRRVMVRLTQLRACHWQHPSAVESVTSSEALLSEIDALPARSRCVSEFEGAVLGVCSQQPWELQRDLSNWVSLLSRFRLLRPDSSWKMISHTTRRYRRRSGDCSALGIAGLDSVKKLEGHIRRFVSVG